MKLHKEKALHLSYLILIAVLSGFNPLHAADPKIVVESYFNALVNGDISKAEKYWHPDEIADSKRLGITYGGNHVKFDEILFLGDAVGDLKDRKLEASVVSTEKYAHGFKVAVRFTGGSISRLVTYLLVPDGKDYKVVSSLYFHTREWFHYYTRFATVHFSDHSLVNEYAVSKLDSVILSICDQLNLSDEKMKRLQESRIDYYLCNEEQFKILAGFSAHGIANLQFDAVISRHLLHSHELVHLLINYALDDPHPYTIPFLQEGLAVVLGGRWEKSPDVAMQVGYVVISEKLLKPFDVLTYDGFHGITGSHDFSYPVAGIFARLLIDICGIEKFKRLYQEFSGSETDIKSIMITDIISQIEVQSGRSWDQIELMFEQYWRQYEFNGIKPGGQTAGKPDMTFKSGDIKTVMWDENDFYQVEIESKSSYPEGILLFSEKMSRPSGRYESHLFNEHTGGKKYQGEILGVRFSKTEVGLYNYLTNLLITKYVTIFSPSESYWNENTGILRFRIDKSAFNGNLGQYKLHLIDINRK
jgi:hypothetical protein